MADINKSGYKITKSGSVRQAGTISEGDASTGRGATAREGTLPSNNNRDIAEGQKTYKPAFSSGGLGTKSQRFRPTPGRGKVI